MPIWEYSGRCQPVMTFNPKRPWLMELIVEAMRATMAGGITSVAAVANNLILVVTAASPAISVKDFEIMIPKFSLAPEPTQFDHRKREVEAVFLGPKHDLLVEIEARSCTAAHSPTAAIRCYRSG